MRMIGSAQNPAIGQLIWVTLYLVAFIQASGIPSFAVREIRLTSSLFEILSSIPDFSTWRRLQRLATFPLISETDLLSILLPQKPVHPVDPSLIKRVPLIPVNLTLRVLKLIQGLLGRPLDHPQAFLPLSPVIVPRIRLSHLHQHRLEGHAQSHQHCTSMGIALLDR